MAGVTLLGRAGRKKIRQQLEVCELDWSQSGWRKRMVGGRCQAKMWGQMDSRPLEEEEEGAQQGWLCFKDRHSTVPLTFSHREEFRSIFAD